ncbi:MAG: aldo/keto reductase [Candidatus Latescibacterota bacterium]
MNEVSRRDFLSSVTALAAGGLAGMSVQEAMSKPAETLAESLPKRILGRTGWKTSIIGYGTIFRNPEPGRWLTDAEADQLINTAIDCGINLFEIGAIYDDAERWVGKVLPKRRRDELFISTKSTKVKKDLVLRELEASLKLLNTDHVDCFDMHNYYSFIHYDEAMGPGGAFEALKQAQKEGKTRFIGITGHSCQVTMHAMRTGEFDMAVIPYNLGTREFDRALRLAAKLNVGVLNMKPYGGTFLLQANPKDPLQVQETLSPEQCLRYVLSHPGVSAAIPNSSRMEQLKHNLAIAATFTPLTETERREFEAKADRKMGGVCGLCKDNPCEKACPNEVPISYMLSNLQASRAGYHDNWRRGDQYQALPVDFTACDRQACGLCEKACPKNLSIVRNLETYHNTVREYRARQAVSPYWKQIRYDEKPVNNSTKVKA